MPPRRSDRGLAELRAERLVLDGGLRVLAVPMPAVHRTVADVFVRVGSRFETADTNGISHFLEHLLFRGTARFPSAHELALAFERNGAALSAATAADHSVVGLSAPPATFLEALPWLAEVVIQPLLEGLEIERGIVREEILETLDDAGRVVDASLLLRAQCFPGHPLGWPITGTLGELEHFGVLEARAHHRAHYTAPGTVIAVAGPIDPGEILSAVGACFAGMPAGTPPACRPPDRAPESRFAYVEHPGSQTSLGLGLRAPGIHDRLEPATELLLRVLDDGMSTRLYHRICDERGLCYDVSASYEPYADAGLVEVLAETAHEHAEDLLGELFGILRELRDRGPRPDELEKAQARHRWQLEEMFDDPGAVAEFFALGELSDLPRTPAERLAELDRVTRDELCEAAARTLGGDGLSVVAVGSLSRRTQQAMAALAESWR
jgi:predicted Zn-dependent peptidase